MKRKWSCSVEQQRSAVCNVTIILAPGETRMCDREHVTQLQVGEGRRPCLLSPAHTEQFRSLNAEPIVNRLPLISLRENEGTPVSTRRPW